MFSMRVQKYTAAVMPVLISMLRGVNVVGRNRIKMDALRALYESLKLEDPRTYIQSGNVIFRSKGKNSPALARKIQDAIEGFGDLSDGERQLLMVLGLIRISRGKRSLFLLDEPDTHLNPLWQLTYLDLIREWTGLAGDANKCQIVVTSHNPLTIAALEREDVRVMFVDEAGKVIVSPPYADPKGMGFTATLTEIFGLPTSLDPETQRQVDERNTLARIDNRTEEQEKQLIAINDKLNRLGFMFEDREPLYQDFLRASQSVRYANRPPLSPEQIKARHDAMKELIEGIGDKKRKEVRPI
jgi:hypothetical protein